MHIRQSVEKKRGMDNVDALAKTDSQQLSALGYTEELRRNRSKITLLAQALIISNITYGIGGPLSIVVAGGGQLSLFVGWIVVSVLYECIALSLAELASRYPTSAGPYFWSYQLCSPRYRKALSYVTGWTWVTGNWTTSLSAHFGLANYVCAIIALYKPDLEITTWQITLMFIAFLFLTNLISTFGNRYLPYVDSCAAVLIGVAIVATCIGMCIKAGAGRHTLRETFAHYDTSFSGWGSFSFAVGLLPSAYTYCAIGMITSMAEEAGSSAVSLPQAIASIVPISFVAGLFFIVPICYTLPPLADLLEASYGQGLPFVYAVVLDSPGAGFAFSFITLIILVLSCISITTAVSRTTWAFARDEGIPLSRWFAKVNPRTETPLNAAILAAVVQLLLGFISLGSSSAFNSFVSVSVMSLAASYAIPIAISICNRRKEIMTAQWNCGKMVGPIVNVVALVWIMALMVLFSMPAYIPVTAVTMTYASVVFVGFMALAFVWYIVHARKVYNGPPESDSLAFGH